MSIGSRCRLALAVLMCAACSLVTTAAAQKSMSISGRVIGWRDFPIANATVTFAAAQRQVLTDSEGRFTITAKVKPGCWRVVFAFIGYDHLNLYLPLHSGKQSLGDVTLVPTPLGGVDVIERRCAGTEDTWTGSSYPIAHAVVTGTLLNSAGQPAPGRLVYLSCSAAETIPPAMTDSIGRYSVAVVVTQQRLTDAPDKGIAESSTCKPDQFAGLRVDSTVVRLSPWKKRPRRNQFDLVMRGY